MALVEFLLLQFFKALWHVTNVTLQIPPEKKHEGRFSSKYRGSYQDRIPYKPTVPTITPSTVSILNYSNSCKYYKYLFSKLSDINLQDKAPLYNWH